MHPLQTRFDALVGAVGAPPDVDAPAATPRAELGAKLQSLAVDLAAEALPWRAEAPPYTRHLLARSAQTGATLYAVAWCEGATSPVHDHETWGLVAVVRGALTEERWRRAEPAPPRVTGPAGALVRGARTGLQPSDLLAFPAGHVHAVTGRGSALSLHLYGGLQRAYLRFDLSAGTQTLVPDSDAAAV